MTNDQFMTPSKILLTCCGTIAVTGVGAIATIERVLAQETQPAPAVNSIMLSPIDGQSIVCFPHDDGGYCISIFPYSQTVGESAPPRIEIRTPAIAESEETPEIYVNVIFPVPESEPTLKPTVETTSPAAPATGSILNIDRAGESNLEPLW